jgi:hypothetical protein
MAEMNFDPEDTALIAVVVVASAVMAGAGTFELFNVSMTDTASLGGATVSLAYLFTVLALGATFITNEMGLRDVNQRAKDELDDLYYGALIVTFALLIFWPFVPSIKTFVRSQDLWSLLFIAAQTAGQIAIGYIK